MVWLILYLHLKMINKNKFPDWMNELLETGQHEWDLVIKPRSSIFKLNLKEIWHYRYLLVMFVKRDIVSVYKQTILGPIWFFIQPILTTIVFVLFWEYC